MVENKEKMGIIIRKAKKGDGKGWVDMWNEGIKRKFFVYNSGNILRTRKDIYRANKKYSEKTKNNFVFLAFDGDKVVGACGATASTKGRLRHRIDLGWTVHPDYTGQGIASQLLDATLKEAKKRGFRRAEAEVAVENIPSVKLAKKLGFSVEGIKKKGLLLDNGKYVDTYIFGKILD